MRTRSSLRDYRLTFAVAALIGLGRVAQAHEIESSVLDVVVSHTADAAEVDVSLGVHAHLVDLAAASDEDQDGALTQGELDQTLTSLEAYLLARLDVMADGQRCAGRLAKAEPTRRGGGQLRLHYRCATRAAAIDIDNRVFFDLVPSHTFIGTLRDGGRAFQLRLEGANRRVHYVAELPTLQEATTLSLIGEYIVLGFEHILGGLDHLLFVFTLVIVARRFKDLVWLVSSFTLAHSLTLTLAALDIFTLPSSFVEPAIALTIVAVAAMNVVTRGERPHRPWLVFLFGLLHGFGFAGALAETGLPTHDVPWALGAFNVGVEFGQLGVVVVLWPLVMLLAKNESTWYRRLVPASSAIVGALAVVWFVERLQGA